MKGALVYYYKGPRRSLAGDPAVVRRVIPLEFGGDPVEFWRGPLLNFSGGPHQTMGGPADFGGVRQNLF
jgi:hypothetical protein